MAILTIKQAAKYLGCSVQQLYAAPRNYHGFKYNPGPNGGGKWHFDTDDLDKLIVECKAKYPKHTKNRTISCSKGVNPRKSGGMTSHSRANDIAALLERPINILPKSMLRNLKTNSMR